MDLVELKSKWNAILDLLEKSDRVAWLTFFDARLANFDGKFLKLDFADPEKFSGNHNYQDARSKFAPLLVEAIAQITGFSVEVVW